MTSVIRSLADILHGSDADGSMIAFELKTLVSYSPWTGHVWDAAGPPVWHPTHPAHPHHDFHNDYGNSYRGHRDLPANTVAAHKRPDAEAWAASVRGDERFVLPSRRAEIESNKNSLVHHDHPHHDLYLANPEWYHHLNGHSYDPETVQSVATGFEDYIVGRVNEWGGNQNHPLNHAHPDRDHYLDAHATNGHDTAIRGGPGSVAGSGPGIHVSHPYSVAAGQNRHGGPGSADVLLRASRRFMSDYGDFANYLGRVARRLEDKIDEVAESAVAAKYFMDDVTRYFAQQVDPYHNPWARMKKNYGHAPLVHTGAMLRAALSAAGNVRFDAAGTMYVDDTKPAYLKFQCYGTATIPAREFLKITTETYIKIEDEVRRQLVAKASGEGA